MLGQPLYMVTPQVVGLQARGPAARGRDRDRPRPHRHPDAAQEGRRREVRGVLRPRPRRDEPRRPRHDREHGPRVRRHLRLLPGGRRDARATCGRTGRSPAEVRPRRALLQGAGALPHRRRRPSPSSPTRSSSTSARVEPSLAGPKRPQDRVALAQMKESFRKALTAPVKERGFGLAPADTAKAVDRRGARAEGRAAPRLGRDRRHHELHQHLEPVGDAGRGPPGPQGRRAGACRCPPYVKTSLAPGSQGRHRVPAPGRASCPTSRPSASTWSATAAPPASATAARCRAEVSKAVNDGKLVAAAVLSGNRNFEGRVNPDVKANYLASPPLVVAYALAGTTDIDLATEPLGTAVGRGERSRSPTSGPPRRRSRSSRPRSGPAMFQRELRERVRRQPRLERDPGGRAATSSPSGTTRPTSRSRRSSRGSPWSRPPSPTSRARASSPSSATR